ncbi:uncharacterized protein PV07_11993 [Cladophialophora immunda]|uniref:Alpha/beta hydrolase fold-3 domain-containing protein n=1 Tax=Cladophialophora immunda TaxID=569365 RepID=A0A0D2BXH1_9EURO|nr:uncharacterized protein PV07_11993 [Cladophialophora immunda]KIW23823.1 hypothetical protein PV07_11993 [Cladophialophora immunda]
MNSEGHRVPSESQSNVQFMRRWFKDNARKADLRPRCEPLKTPVAVEVSLENVKYGQGGGEQFQVRVYEPQDGSQSEGINRPALIMYHGGGWVLGDPTADEDLSIFFASELRAVIFSVDYRLAPEHDLRTMHNDCYEALNWVTSPDISATYRVDLSRLGLWGCSAGAHLGATGLLRDAVERASSRLRQASLVVPAVCHPHAFSGLLGQTFEKKKQTYLKETPSSFLGHIENLFGNVV